MVDRCAEKSHYHELVLQVKKGDFNAKVDYV